MCVGVGEYVKWVEYGRGGFLQEVVWECGDCRVGARGGGAVVGGDGCDGAVRVMVRVRVRVRARVRIRVRVRVRVRVSLPVICVIYVLVI